jgi:hypothetical protein
VSSARGAVSSMTAHADGQLDHTAAAITAFPARWVSRSLDRPWTTSSSRSSRAARGHPAADGHRARVLAAPSMKRRARDVQRTGSAFTA